MRGGRRDRFRNVACFSALYIFFPPSRCVTTKGSILNTSTFTAEDDEDVQMSNDDRILKTALNLCREHAEEKRGRSLGFYLILVSYGVEARFD